MAFALRSLLWRYAVCASAAVLADVSCSFLTDARAADLEADSHGPRATVSAAASLAPTIQRVLPAIVTIFAAQKSPIAENGERESAMPRDVRELAVSDVPRGCRQRWDGKKVSPSSRDASHSIGSGFIIDPAGLVVTTAQLTADARKLTVQLYDGSRHTAHLVGSDGLTDVALVKIDAAGPTPSLDWGDSDTALIGDWVLAPGSPFGLSSSVRLGIVSARGRNLNLGPYDDFLQIDASINRGDSGGPEVNLKGEVIGINVAIYSSDAESVGIAFATPSKLAKVIIDELKERGRVERGWLGVQAQAVTPEIAQSFGLHRAEGLVVDHVSDAGPAAAAGLERGDIILSIDDHPFSDPSELPFMISQIPIGAEVRLRVWRDRKEMWIKVIVARMPEVAGAQALNHQEAQQQTCE